MLAALGPDDLTLLERLLEKSARIFTLEFEVVRRDEDSSTVQGKKHV